MVFPPAAADGWTAEVGDSRLSYNICSSDSSLGTTKPAGTLYDKDVMFVQTAELPEAVYEGEVSEECRVVCRFSF